MSAGRIAQHRNYGEIMARHERDAKLKRITRIFTYFILILVIVLLFFFLRRWENNQHEKVKESTAHCMQVSASVFEKS
jgi:uncharacterized membrane protein